MTTTKRKGKTRNKLMMFGFGILAAGLMLCASPMTAYASQSFNPPPARTQPAPEQLESKQIDTDIRLDLLEYNHLHEDDFLRITL